MRNTFLLLSILIAIGCDKHQTNIPSRVEVRIGEPFTISSPAEIYIQNNGFTFSIGPVSDYITYGIVAPEVHAKIEAGGQTNSLSHQLACEEQICDGRQIGPNSFAESLPLTNELTLRFIRISKSTVLVNHGPGRDKVRPDSVQFVIENSL